MMTRLACVTVLSLAVLLGVRARAIFTEESVETSASALINGTVDVDNDFNAVGAVMITVRADNPFGLPEGAIIAMCTGTLIHERVFLTAGHCTAQGVIGAGSPPMAAWPPFIRPVVSFSPLTPADMATWHDISLMTIHPSFICNDPSGFPPTCCDPSTDNCPPGAPIPRPRPFHDVGLMILAEPVTDIKPAKLGKNGVLEKPGAQGESMIVVGYGLTSFPVGDFGHRRYGPSTFIGLMTELNREEFFAKFSIDQAHVCYGDSGGPTFFHNRVVALGADGSDDCMSWDTRSRVDNAVVGDWIDSVINGLYDERPRG
jgi:hypothetical protein